MAKRSCAMRCRPFPAIMLMLVAAGCDRAREPTPQAIASEAAPEAPRAGVTAVPTPAASVGAPPALDTGALTERKDPDRVLRFYAAALHARDWAAAARAWGRGSGVTARTLKASYDRAEAPLLEIGEGDEEGAAGSLFYEAPVTLRFGPDNPPERGSLVLRRVNDVPGATAEQLRWHIERSTIGQGR
jgi:hypothetical protein